MIDALLPPTIMAAHATGDAWTTPALSCETEELEPAISAGQFRDALAHAATAVTVIATAGAAGMAGVTCSAVCSVCDTPPTILFCVNRTSASNRLIKENGLVSVNWLNSRQKDVSQLFAGVGNVPMQDRFDSERWQISPLGVPYCTQALVTFECRIASVTEIGTHSVFLARVLGAMRADGADPLVYCQRAYATTSAAHS